MAAGGGGPCAIWRRAGKGAAVADGPGAVVAGLHDVLGKVAGGGVRGDGYGCDDFGKSFQQHRPDGLLVSQEQALIFVWAITYSI